MVLDDAKEILEKAKVLVPLLQKGAVCAGGTCEPKVEEEGNVAVEKWLNPGKS